MATVLEEPQDLFSEAVRKLEISILVSQLTFVKVLAEGFDFLAADSCNGLEILSELCALRAKDLKHLGMKEEAELLAHLKDSLLCQPQQEDGKGVPEQNGTDEIDVLYRIEFVKIMMGRLIDVLDNEVKKMPGRKLQAA
jgi:hypothetical protein